jgi:stress response protein YsnF
MNQTVIGIFDKKEEAQTAVEQLISKGIAKDHIDVAAESSAATQQRLDQNEDKLSNFFSNLFGNNDEANKYSEVARRGWIVTVHTDSRQEAQTSAETLDRYGAVDVDERAQQFRSGGSASTASHQRNESDKSIPIIEENMEVGKRVVERGGVRMRSRIVERPVEEHLRLREEHLHVERNPVNRPASEADLKNFKEGEMEIREKAEVPIVNKEARVVEEIKLGKEVNERTETIRDTVRKSDVDIEKINPNDDRTRTNPNDDRDRTNPYDDRNRNPKP